MRNTLRGDAKRLCILPWAACINHNLQLMHNKHSRLTLLHHPQDPVIFSGSVRSNLDPFSQAGSDAEVWEALRRAGVDGFVRDMEVCVLLEQSDAVCTSVRIVLCALLFDASLT